MVDFVKYDMTDIWASAGDITAPSSGKIATGWIVEAVPRQWWNWFENRQDNNIAYMLQKGIPEWDAVTEYQTNKSYIQRNSIVYKCILANSNSDPATSPTKWVKAFPDSSAALEALGALTPAADKLAYFTDGTTAALTTLTSFARTLLDDTTNTAARTTLGAQASHANLTALSGVTAATNILPYFNSASTMLGTSLTAFGRSILDDADAAAGRATLGLGTAAVANVTTSDTDQTVGAQLKVGDFGIGAGGTVSSKFVPTWPNTSLNDITGVGSGLYRTISGTTNSINGAAAIIIFAVQNADAVRATQLLISTDIGGAGNNMVFRSANGGTLAAPTWSTTEDVASKAEVYAQMAEFGLGATNGVVTTDLNTVTTTGFYKFTGTAANIPLATAAGLLINSIYDANYRTQLVITLTGTDATKYNRTFTRTYNSATWGAWKELVDAASLATTLAAYALKGANSDITSLSGLTTALSVAQGGTGTTTSTGTGSIVLSASPTFTGTPLTTTAAPGTNTTQIASTAFVAALGALKANLASPTFTGIPAAPTAAPGTNTTQLATTAFVTAADNLKANLASPSFTGLPLAPTAAVNTQDTQIATTAFVVNQIGASAQTSFTDNTANRLLVVGAFGLGANGTTVPSTSNITSTINVGFYKFSGGVTGAPPQFAGAGGSLIVHSLGGNFLQQIAISIPGALNNPMMCMRHYDTTGNPGAWVTMYTNANTVGTVSVTGVLPTGAIIETGTNANGTYTKYTDGTLINQGPIADFNVTANAQATLSPNGTFAHPFISGAYYCQVMGAPNTTNDHYGFTSVNARATTAVNYVHRNGATAQIMVNIRYVAIGRWF